MDSSTKLMIEECYLETVQEALAAGHSKDVAHKEGITGAAMLLSSMAGMEDDVARAQVMSLGLKPEEDD